jgi:hypothetical protein
MALPRGSLGTRFQRGKSVCCALFDEGNRSVANPSSSEVPGECFARDSKTYSGGRQANLINDETTLLNDMGLRHGNLGKSSWLASAIG